MIAVIVPLKTTVLVLASLTPEIEAENIKVQNQNE